ncbi:MAG: O-antigen ligase family protein, partial [Crocinitomicaceae bacterium]|nr:O-antigen ligase family protein [Crocinitomicaceae bacterium]
AWHMFLDRPFFGFGPATYAFEYAAYQDPQKLTIISTNFGDGGNAHSEYLGPLAETGVIGLITVLVFVGLLFYTGIRLYIQYPAHLDGMKIIILCLVLAMATYFFHGILNNYLDTDKAAVPVYGTCAMFIALQNRLKHGKF